MNDLTIPRFRAAPGCGRIEDRVPGVDSGLHSAAVLAELATTLANGAFRPAEFADQIADAFRRYVVDYCLADFRVDVPWLIVHVASSPL